MIVVFGNSYQSMKRALYITFRNAVIIDFHNNFIALDQVLSIIVVYHNSDNLMNKSKSRYYLRGKWEKHPFVSLLTPN